MDYEQKYNEALERAKELYNNANASKVRREWLEEIFPELAESEDVDERIAKAIPILRQQRDYWSYEGSCDKKYPLVRRDELVEALDIVFEYIEKQKKRAVVPDELVECYKEFCENGGRELATLINAINGLEKNECIIDAGKTSESEDERIRKELIEFLDGVWHLGKNANFDKWGKADCAKWIAWLEKQKGSLHITESCKENADSLTDEDERIRKMVIGAVNFAASAKGGLLHSEASECLAWLEEQKDKNCLACDQHLKGYLAGRKVTEEEKQKERGPLTKDEEYILNRIIEYLEDEGCPSYWMELLRDIHNLPYQKVQKPEGVYVDCTEHPEWYGMPPKEQKPVEWSEEDDACRIEAVKLLENPSLYESCPNLRQETIEWLKQLPKVSVNSEQVSVNSEWSEEDEKPFNDVLSGLKYAYEDLINNKSLDSAKDIKEAFDWMQARVKSFRGIIQNGNTHWKPSEEQMKALLNIEGDLRAFQYNDKAKIIAELYEQLKRL